jgi:hypothetical protein
MPRPSTIVLWGLVTVAAGGTPVKIRDVDGRWLTPFQPAARANAIFFVSADCPISNAYAPEIQRLCGQFASQGVGCSLIYEDLPPDVAAARRHLDEYAYRGRGISAAVDSVRTIARAAHASITPQAVIVDATGAIKYRGRIDNRYAALGKPRPQATTHDLIDALDATLAGRPVAALETQAVGCAIVPADFLRK